MSDKCYYMPQRAAESRFVDRKSEFLGHLMPVENEEEVLIFLQEMKKKYADARHNVWAYTLANGSMRSSDDGEPSGTGGAPVLDAMVKRGITNTVIVVTRYFGGILLGTGGLVHAYSAAASACLDEAGRVRVKEYLSCSVLCGYDRYNIVSKLAYKYDSCDFEGVFEEDVHCTFLLPPEQFEKLSEELKEKSAGKLSLEICGTVAVKIKE